MKCFNGILVTFFFSLPPFCSEPFLLQSFEHNRISAYSINEKLSDVEEELLLFKVSYLDIL
jgi:hypothetical protein